MNVIVGIPSWLPSDYTRGIRIKNLRILLKQINSLWPDINIYIYAQCWDIYTQRRICKEYQHIHLKTVNSRSGILKARKELRNWLLSTNADYFMLFDDDAHIVTKNNAHIELIKQIELHPQGWSFSRYYYKGYNPNKYNPFADSQLNFAIISRYVFEKEDFPELDPERSVGFEDRIFSMTLYCKYPSLYWKEPIDIYSDHFHNGQPSTWAKRKKYDWKHLRENTENLEKELLDKYNPPNIDDLC